VSGVAPVAVGDCAANAAALARRFGLALREVDDDAPITGSFWGEPEAGIAGRTVYARRDTPLHSFLHELGHLVCMPAARRAGVLRDAGGDDAEECAVCYLQVLLAGEFPGVGQGRLMRDMDGWGYSFRLGSTGAWFERDADDARRWLERHRLIDGKGRVTFRLRGESAAPAKIPASESPAIK